MSAQAPTPLNEMKPFNQRIVVGMDGSDSAKTAAQWAAREARLRGQGLTLAHAVVPVVIDGAFGLGVPPRLDFIDELVGAAESELAQLAEDLDFEHIDIHVEVGTPSEMLVTASESATMIVVGSRGQGGFRGLLLGSIGSQVASHAHCPVVVMRQAQRPDATEVVVGIDGSPHSVAALDFAFDEASRHGWSIVAVHAWELPSYDLIIASDGPLPVPLENVADDEVRLAAEVLSGYRENYPDVEVFERLVRAYPPQAILDCVADAALIVLGTRGRNAALSAILGSVSYTVLHRAKVPVAIVPLPGETLES